MIFFRLDFNVFFIQKVAKARSRHHAYKSRLSVILTTIWFFIAFSWVSAGERFSAMLCCADSYQEFSIVTENLENCWIFYDEILSCKGAFRKWRHDLPFSRISQTLESSMTYFMNRPMFISFYRTISILTFPSLATTNSNFLWFIALKQPPKKKLLSHDRCASLLEIRTTSEW